MEEGSVCRKVNGQKVVNSVSADMITQWCVFNTISSLPFKGLSQRRRLTETPRWWSAVFLFFIHSFGCVYAFAYADVRVDRLGASVS